MLIAGDIGAGDEGEMEVARAMAKWAESRRVLALLLLGDNIYPDGNPARFAAAIARPLRPLLAAGVRIYPVLGNHDVLYDGGAGELGLFGLARSYYSFEIGSVTYFALDSTAFGQEQAAWLRKALAEAETPWKAVYLHHPLYSSGLHGPDLALRAALVPLLKEGGVQLVLSGHDHDYERTQAIDGVVYVVSGGGSSVRPVGRSAFTAVSASRLHFLWLRADPYRLQVEAIGTDGKPFDAFVLVKEGSRAEPSHLVRAE